jgi:hypothetical protein
MSEYSIRLAKPHCDDCHKPKGALPEVAMPTNGPLHAVVYENANDTASSLRGRLSSVLQGKADDEGDI